jgi:hypothetical protein
MQYSNDRVRKVPNILAQKIKKMDEDQNTALSLALEGHNIVASFRNGYMS